MAGGARTLCVGGDHSISLPILRAISKYHGGPVNLIQFDAHNDLWDEYFGSKYSHGTPFRRAAEVPVPLYINLKELPPVPAGAVPDADFISRFVLESIRRDDADLAEAGRIPPASGGSLDHQNFVAIIENYRAASDTSGPVAVVTRLHLVAPLLIQRLMGGILNRLEGTAHPRRLVQQLFVALRVKASGIEGEPGTRDRAHALDEACELKKEV